MKVSRANNYRLGMCAHFIDTAMEDDSIPAQPVSVTNSIWIWIRCYPSNHEIEPCCAFV